MNAVRWTGTEGQDKREKENIQNIFSLNDNLLIHKFHNDNDQNNDDQETDDNSQPIPTDEGIEWINPATAGKLINRTI